MLIRHKVTEMFSYFVRVGAILSCLQDFPPIISSDSLTKMIKKTLIVTTDTLSKFSLTKFLMENFDSDNGPLAH
jgi:hypothetical protein